jgi:hypothetical protein
VPKTKNGSDDQFTQPEEITAPRLHWSLIKVLFKGAPEEHSIALGRWDGEPRLAVRWNACEWRPVGNPHSRGLPWFILPEPLVEAVLGSLDPDVQTFVRNFIPANARDSETAL